MRTARYYLSQISRTKEVFYPLSEEERSGLKKCLLEMYVDVLAVCEKHHLRVMLGGGTALGAVRHGGFIPWDDDLDLMMPREDYDQFFTVFAQETQGKYLTFAPRHGEGKCLFGKVIRKGTVLSEAAYRDVDETDGIYIDVFPIDRMPNNRFLCYLKGKCLDMFRIGVTSIDYYKERRFLKQNILGVDSFLFFYIRFIIGFCFNLVGYQRMLAAFDRLAASSRGDRYWSIPTGRAFALGEIHPQEIFFPLRETKFEGVKAYLPNQVEVYLQRLYGDYMRIPPIDQRERHYVVHFSLSK